MQNYKKPLYSVWDGMKKRCHVPCNPAYKWYGGRGIHVCRKWRYNFPEFERWALAHGWKKGLTIERIKVNKGYSPGNCTFIPLEQQNRNRRDNVRVKAFGEIKLLKEWAEDPRCKVGYATLHDRFRRRGESIEDAIATPRKHKNNKTHCQNGHPFNEENTVYTKQDTRKCRKCLREWRRQNYAKNREKINERRRAHN